MAPAFNKFNKEINGFITIKRFDELEGVDQHLKDLLNARIEEVGIQFKAYVNTHYENQLKMKAKIEQYELLP